MDKSKKIQLETNEHESMREEETRHYKTMWDQYNTHIELFKFFTNTSWQMFTWFYAITGAILLFYFNHTESNLLLRYVLVLPGILSFSFYKICELGIKKNKEYIEWTIDICNNLNLKSRPHVELLGEILLIYRMALLLGLVSLVILFVSSFSQISTRIMILLSSLVFLFLVNYFLDERFKTLEPEWPSKKKYGQSRQIS